MGQGCVIICGVDLVYHPKCGWVPVHRLSTCQRLPGLHRLCRWLLQTVLLLIPALAEKCFPLPLPVTAIAEPYLGVAARQLEVKPPYFECETGHTWPVLKLVRNNLDGVPFLSAISGLVRTGLIEFLADLKQAEEARCDITLCYGALLVLHHVSLLLW
jgi:hypothetical protein